jgi:hypothetical protein
MFDFDQRRTALPNNGTMYCVPVSFMNKIAYLGKYSTTAMINGYDPANYTQMNSLALLLGVLMGTSPTQGTSGSIPVEVAWIDGKTNRLVVFAALGPSANWSYRTVMNQFRAGALVRMGYGRYKLEGSSWSRKSGHSVGLAGYYRSDSTNSGTFFVADPATDEGDYTKQSPFVFQIKDTNDITLTTENHGVVTHARYTNWVGGSANYPGSWRAVVDSALFTLPFFAGWTVPTLDGNHIDVRFQFMPGPPTGEFPTSYRVTTTDGIRDWCFDMMNFGVCWISSTGQVKLRSVSVDDTQTLMTSAAARKVVIGGPNQDVFVLREGSAFDSVSRISRKNGLITTVNLPEKAAAFDVDESTGGLAVVNRDLDSVLVFDPSLKAMRREPLFGVAPIRPGVTIQSANAAFSVDSLSGDYFLAIEGVPAWIRYTKQGNVRIGHETAINLRDGIKRIAAGPQKTVVVQDMNDRIHTYRYDGSPKATEFSGLQAAGPIRAAKTINAYRLQEIVGPDWINVFPEGDNP